MKAEIELENGDCVDVVFECNQIDQPDRAHGINRPFYHFVIDYYTPYCGKTGQALPPIKGRELQITESIYEQLAEAFEDEMHIEADLNRYQRGLYE